LAAEPRPLAERAAVRLFADEGEPARAEVARKLLEPLGRAGEIVAAKIARAGRRSVGRVRQSDSRREKLVLLVRLVQPRREVGCMEQPPEVVARVGEMRSSGGRDPAGVDPAEDNP